MDATTPGTAQGTEQGAAHGTAHRTAQATTAGAPHEPALLAQALLEAWARAFALNDPAAMPPLYREDAAMYGSRPELFCGRDGVASYFGSLAPRRIRRVRFEQVQASRPLPDVLAVAAVAFFEVDELAPIAMRFTQTWLQDARGWRVLSHHASPRLMASGTPALEAAPQR